jgi:hypothetical protein
MDSSYYKSLLFTSFVGAQENRRLALMCRLQVTECSNKEKQVSTAHYRRTFTGTPRLFLAHFLGPLFWISSNPYGSRRGVQDSISNSQWPL